jgi:PucR family transcriptional regulator, purine catabolism regulatory protein
VPATLRSLADNRAFGLRVVVEGHDASGLDQPLPWAHSSDLPDPTPWLEAGQLLLTNGAQFPLDASDEMLSAYVERLAGSRIGGLGFATEVVHGSVPDGLARACQEVGLPLLEVRQRSPFIAIIRHVADALASDQRERLEWFLDAQRALARAALRPDGLGAVLHELERRLECWVALFDAAGNPVPVSTLRPIPERLEREVGETVRSVLSRGLRAGMRLAAADGDVTLQTIGQRDQLRGVLAVGSAAPLDAAGTDLVASVIALASISVEQTRTLEEAREHLRSGLLELMLAGALDVARSTAHKVGDDFPDPPVRVAVFAQSPHNEPVRQDLDRGDTNGRRPWFVAHRAGAVVVTVGVDATDDLVALLVRHHVHAGVSGEGTWSELGDLLDEAERAQRRSGHGEPVARFETMYGHGLLGLLDHEGGAELSHRMLAPLRQHPDQAVLTDSLRAWFEHGCAWDPASRSLGVHRHTLRNRVRAVEELLDLDLESFAGRAELWIALQFDAS